MTNGHLNLDRERLDLALNNTLPARMGKPGLKTGVGQYLSQLETQRNKLMNELDLAIAHDAMLQEELGKIRVASTRALDGMSILESRNYLYKNSAMESPEYTVVAIPSTGEASLPLFPWREPKQGETPQLHTSTSVDCVGATWGALDYAFDGHPLGISLEDDRHSKVMWFDRWMMAGEQQNPSLKGSVDAISTRGLGREITDPHELREGDFLQIWWLGDGVWRGHSSLIHKIERDGQGNISKLSYISATPPSRESGTNAIRVKHYAGQELKEYIASMGRVRDPDGNDLSRQLYAARIYDKPGIQTYRREKDLERDRELTNRTMTKMKTELHDVELMAWFGKRALVKNAFHDLPLDMAERTLALLARGTTQKLTQKDLDNVAKRVADLELLNKTLGNVSTELLAELQEQLSREVKHLMIESMEKEAFHLLNISAENMKELDAELAAALAGLEELERSLNMRNQERYLLQKERVDDLEMTRVVVEPLKRMLVEQHIRNAIESLVVALPMDDMNRHASGETSQIIVDQIW